MAAAPLIIAHRGASGARPENTAAAFDAALDEGADGIELDLQFSRDGVVVVCHDQRLDRVAGVAGRIAECDWAELARLDVGAGNRLLRLEQVLERWAPRTRLYLEIKCDEGRGRDDRHRALARCTADTVRMAGAADRVAVLSFHDLALEVVGEVAPALPLVRNVRRRRELAAVAERGPPLAAVCVAVDRVAPADVAPVRARGLPVYVYTCDTSRAFRRARALDAAAVLTNRPAVARAWYIAHA